MNTLKKYKIVLIILVLAAAAGVFWYLAGEEALVFFSTDPDIGDVREVWFVHLDHLYQASTYAKYDELLAKVMRTFRFKN